MLYWLGNKRDGSDWRIGKVLFYERDTEEQAWEWAEVENEPRFTWIDVHYASVYAFAVRDDEVWQRFVDSQARECREAVDSRS